MGTMTAERLRVAASLPRHRWTVADFDRMLGSGLLDEADRVELIEGELIDMAPIGSKHAYTVDSIARMLQRLVGNRYLVRVQNPLRLGESSEPQPDIAVVLDRSYAAAHPEAADVLLLIEVADTTLEFDRDIKLPLYARHGIPECWLIDVAGRQLSIHREPAEGEYRHICRPTSGKTLHLLASDGPALRAAELFAD